MFRKILLAAAWLLVAVAMGLYVYPVRPSLVWVLLGICWACYRLSLRAQALFGRPDGTGKP